MRRHPLLTTLAGLTGLALGLAACGGSSSSGNAGGSSTTSSSTTVSTVATTTTSQAPATSTTAAPQASMSAARAALLTLADMPASWTSAKSSSGPRGLNHAQSIEVAQCLGVPAADVAYNPPEADSPEFDGPGGLPAIDDSILVFPSVALARHEFSILTNARTPQCFAEVLTSSKSQFLKTLPAGSTIGTITVVPLPGFGTVADGGVGLLVRLPVNTQGQSVHLALIVADVLDGPYGISLEATNVTAPVATSFVQRLVQLDISRLP